MRISSASVTQKFAFIDTLPMEQGHNHSHPTDDTSQVA